MLKRFLAAVTGGLLATLAWAQPASVQVAAAANFTAPMRQIAEAFERDTGHKAVLAFGSTGGFYAQIRNGAPFDILLSADDTTPARLAAEGLGVAGSQFTYAVGRLVLWSADPALIDAHGEVLRRAGIARLAVANPKLAPYGLAARQTLHKLGLWEAWQPRLVQGENIAHTYHFVASGNASAGFVALSQVQVDGRIAQGSAWPVPPELHDPIRQDAIVLARGRDNPAAQALMSYLRGDAARRIISRFGYGF